MDGEPLCVIRLSFPLRLGVIPFLRAHAADDVNEEISREGAKRLTSLVNLPLFVFHFAI
jgi:hypothetical protein